MHIAEVLYTDVNLNQYKILKTNCSEFINESQQIPLYRSLPTTLDEISRVKIRHKKKNNALNDAFTEAFESKVRQRSIFASSVKPLREGKEEPYYVFPVNGYKYLYSNDIQNSQTEYNVVCEALFEHCGNDKVATELISDMLKISYHNDNLHEALISKAEILLYSIPAYYAVKASTIDYDELMHIIK
jgi:hypothetical protein